MGVSMIDIGTLVRWWDGTMGIVTSIHETGDKRAYGIQWFDGDDGCLADWQFEVIG